MTGPREQKKLRISRIILRPIEQFFKGLGRRILEKKKAKHTLDCAHAKPIPELTKTEKRIFLSLKEKM